MSRFNRQNRKWLSQPIIQLENYSPSPESTPKPKAQENVIRPSGFLNAVDLLPLLQQQYLVKSHVSRKTTKQTLTLPPVTDRIDNSSRIQFYATPQVKSANQIELPQGLAHHRKQTQSEIPKEVTMKNQPINEEPKKKVVFRKSIQVVDFINGIISRGEINDQSSKPLLRRQKTKLIRTVDS